MSEMPPQNIVHPIQKFINRSAPAVGFMTALFLFAISAFSIFLVINSAYTIGGIIYLLSLIGGLIVLSVQNYLLKFIRKNRLLIQGRKVDNLTLMLIPLLICGFVQTFFWVIDPTSPIHEPRSVFILATAGILSFVRSQTDRAEKNAALNPVSE
jgi:hypothetical protein